MKNVLFLMSHLGSGYEQLFENLCEIEHIDGFETGSSYAHPDDLSVLTENIHKNDNVKAVYLDSLLFNHSLTSSTLCETCKFIFMVREPSGTLRELVDNHNFSEAAAVRYYCLRIGGIHQYLKRIPSAPLVKYESLDLSLAEKYLDISLKNFEVNDNDGLINEDCLSFYNKLYK